MVKIGSLAPGAKFTYQGRNYSVLTHSGLMTEVTDGSRLWAWPFWAKVNHLNNQ